MNKYKITVPKGIKFISEWNDFLNNLTNIPCILHKKVTGCGFTEWAIRNNYNVILCSPRKILLENKESQHLGEVFHFRNEFDTELKYDKNIQLEDERKTSEEIAKETLEKSTIDLKLTNRAIELQKSLGVYYSDCIVNSRPCKILVTYDSFKYVGEVLNSLGVLNNFMIIVDEFQSIFIDAKFKPTVELQFLKYVSKLSKVMFVSASPTLDEDLEQLDEFKDLPYYELDWITEDPTRLCPPAISVTRLYKDSIQTKVTEIISKLRYGNFDEAIIKDPAGNSMKIQSKEAVFFVNSVKNICDIIKKAELKPSECNILCANTTDNTENVRRAFKLRSNEPLQIGVVPRLGEPHKMFTFCTRTAYIGADFYSTNAKTYIFSDANIDCLAVDITIDLPQIMGRQRLDINPWKNCASLFIRMPKKSQEQLTEENFNKLLDSKKQSTSNLISAFNSAPNDNVRKDLIDLLERDIRSNNYKYSYVAIDYDNNNFPVPVVNKLVMLAEIRAFQIQTIDYRDRFSVLSSIATRNSISGFTERTVKFLQQFDLLSSFIDKMKLLVETEFNSDEEFAHVLNQISPEFSSFINILGKDRIRAVGYRKDCCLNLLNLYMSKNELTDLIYSTFNVGDKLKTGNFKENLQDIYNRLELNKTAKASDLNQFFDLKACKVKVDNKWENGFEIINKK